MRTDSDARSDEQIWSRALTGDGEAFAVVFERHADAVYTHCRRRTETVGDAEDLASVTFLECWRLRERVRFVDGSARGWLLLVATNVARNHSRSTRRYRAQLARMPHDADAVDGPAENAERREIVLAVSRAVAALSRTDSEVISLCDLAGLSYTEAAGVLDVPVGTVRSRLSRARGRLRTLLAPMDPYQEQNVAARPTTTGERR